MEKPIIRNCSDQFWFVILLFFLLLSVLLCFDYSAFYDAPNNGFLFSVTKQENPFAIAGNKTSFNPDPCKSRYIYIHELPRKFNYDLLEHCEILTRGTEKANMCPYIENLGFGPEIENSQGVFTNSSWYFTNQFMLEVIFHNKMKSYECLSNDSSLASAIFVPSYAGLDVSRFLWESNEKVRDSSGRELLQWLASKPEWKRMWGRDHFLVSGRIAWDFRRQFDNASLWGSKFRFLPESMNMSMLAVEASSWKNDYAIPYPTSFHPSKDAEILQWQSKIRKQKRAHLFTFIGAARPELENSIRGKIIDHCRNSSFCNFIDCSYDGSEKCDNSINVTKVFENSVFCLQPSGDSYTRRSIFDSMLAGCIPVFFHPGTAYSQYLWHLPKNWNKYSVYIPVRDVKEWNGNVEKILLRFSGQEISAMREEVIKLVPSIIYADSRSKLERFEDAFDLAVKGMLEKIERVREMIRNGKDPALGFADEDHYKYTFSNY
ncbi:hypothetical protein L6164_012100 [Bauhinia variegata]|uniref:Uncharacterized protein n=1 Tax=Bauhinia variegata TaxID=167791 RepID=A0ACB9P836_BAUVA|nr:hypothetical protein L6164_012100 [Bauhinia variegata]